MVHLKVIQTPTTGVVWLLALLGAGGASPQIPAMAMAINISRLPPRRVESNLWVRGRLHRSVNVPFGSHRPVKYNFVHGPFHGA